MASIARLNRARSAINQTHNAPPHTGDEVQQTSVSFEIPDLDHRLNGGIRANGLHEVRCSFARDFACAAGFALGLAAQFGKSNCHRIFWVIDPAASIDSGLPFPDGLSEHGIDPKTLIFVRPITLQDALWAADQAAKCSDLSAVIFQVKGNPRHFDMTATRRLMLRARESGVLVCVLRHSGEEEASAATTRWHVEIMPSGPEPDFEHGLGQARHAQTLERNRHGQTGQWTLLWNPETRAFEDGTSEDDTSKTETTHLVRRLHASVHRSDSPAEMGQVVDFERAS
jgi:protein ImuA